MKRKEAAERQKALEFKKNGNQISDISKAWEKTGQAENGI